MAKNKYNARKFTDPVTGDVFDSKAEFIRWCELRLMEKAGMISGLVRQVKYELLPDQYESCQRFSAKTGKRLKDGIRLVERGVSYIADFVYTDKNGQIVVEDCKGYKTEAYRIKKKLMLYMNGIKIQES